jgi:gliding motility-associated-like protein
VVDLTPAVKLGNDITIFRGDTVKLRAIGSTGSKYFYEWTPATGLNSPNILQPLANPTDSTTYTVKVSSVTSSCSATAKITVMVRERLKIPTAFTPNSDAINNNWVILGNNQELNDYPHIEVKIYNRWGSEIFTALGASNANSFDGKIDGQRLPDGPYFYVIKPSPDLPALTGYVTIVR